MRIRVKICCIMSPVEANMAIQAGADALGLVSEMPGGPGVISLEQMKSILPKIPPSVSVFLLTSKLSAQEIVTQHKTVPCDTIQLVNRLPIAEYARLRQALPGTRLVQVIHVQDETAIDQATELEPFVDALLLDSGNPNASRQILGGTGKTHNWQISVKIRNKVSLPVFLAGGLNAQNVKQAIQTVRPFAVDVCSGVRTNGRLDAKKLSAFFSQLIPE